MLQTKDFIQVWGKSGEFFLAFRRANPPANGSLFLPIIHPLSAFDVPQGTWFSGIPERLWGNVWLALLNSHEKFRIDLTQNNKYENTTAAIVRVGGKNVLTGEYDGPIYEGQPLTYRLEQYHTCPHPQHATPPKLNNMRICPDCDKKYPSWGNYLHNDQREGSEGWLFPNWADDPLTRENMELPTVRFTIDFYRSRRTRSGANARSLGQDRNALTEYGNESYPHATIWVQLIHPSEMNLSDMGVGTLV